MGEIVYFFLLGGVAGVLAGLLGVGGGLVIVPGLVIILSGLGFPSDEVVRVAVATSLGTIVLTSLSSSFAHHRRGAVQWRMAAYLGVGLGLGAFLASYLVGEVSQWILQGLFVCFALAAAYQLYFGKKPQASCRVPARHSLVGVGSVLGVFSGMIGIGGGTLVVPFLVWCNVGMRQAVATASVCGGVIAMAAVAGFLCCVTPAVTLPAGSVGYLYLPALMTIALISVLTAPLGVWMAHRMDTEKLKRIFALLLLVMAGGVFAF